MSEHRSSSLGDAKAVAVAPSGPRWRRRSGTFRSFQEWCLRTYGDAGKTKTVTRKKYQRIVQLLSGGEAASGDNAKFKFWVRSKGFQLGGEADVSAPRLHVPVKTMLGDGTVADGASLRRVAVVEDFYDIIYSIHVETAGGNERAVKHAGQKRTYKAISETYAFLPREAVTKFLMSCTECQKRMHLSPRAAEHKENEHPPALLSNDIDYNLPLTTTYMKHMRLHLLDANRQDEESESVGSVEEQRDMSASAPPASETERRDGGGSSSSSSPRGSQGGDEDHSLSSDLSGEACGPDAPQPAAATAAANGRPYEAGPDLEPAPREAEGTLAALPEPGLDLPLNLSEQRRARCGAARLPLPLGLPLPPPPPPPLPPLSQLIARAKAEEAELEMDTDAASETEAASEPARVRARHGATVKAERDKEHDSPHRGVVAAAAAVAVVAAGYELRRREAVAAVAAVADDASPVRGGDDDDDEHDEDAERMGDVEGADPERLKAFNMFVRLFVDENLDRMVPISKQPKEKVQAILESCHRQFPEFQERARKRIRTYLKSCRRLRKNGLELQQSRTTPPHLTSAVAENILAMACESESRNAAKRIRLDLQADEPMPLERPAHLPHDLVRTSHQHQHLQQQQPPPSFPPPPPPAPMPLAFAGDAPPYVNGSMRYAHHGFGGLGGGIQHPALSAHHNPPAPPPPPALHLANISNGPTDLSMKKPPSTRSNSSGSNSSSGSSSPSPQGQVQAGGAGPTCCKASGGGAGGGAGGCPAQLSPTEVGAVRQLISGYRESAAFLLRSADELENLILQHN
ncbi:nucleolar protein 4-like isoform X2 [Petromyzon marinus]|uniref:nucleolar protein 4-like isoform X2 n=1 Tax=Petromyzon marinus TaxID=7757 RepID=UPI003F730825